MTDRHGEYVMPPISFNHPIKELFWCKDLRRTNVVYCGDHVFLNRDYVNFDLVDMFRDYEVINLSSKSFMNNKKGAPLYYFFKYFKLDHNLTSNFIK